MIINEYTKIIQRSYCKALLAEHGLLTKELADKIDNGDEAEMRAVYVDQQQRIRDRAESIQDPTNKAIILSQVDSIQEVLDSLSAILSA